MTNKTELGKILNRNTNTFTAELMTELECKWKAFCENPSLYENTWIVDAVNMWINDYIKEHMHTEYFGNTNRKFDIICAMTGEVLGSINELSELKDFTREAISKLFHGWEDVYMLIDDMGTDYIAVYFVSKIANSPFCWEAFEA